MDKLKYGNKTTIKPCLTRGKCWGRLDSGGRWARSTECRILLYGKCTSWSRVSLLELLRARLLRVCELVIRGLVVMVLAWTWHLVFLDLGPLRLPNAKSSQDYLALFGRTRVPVSSGL